MTDGGFSLGLFQDLCPVGAEGALGSLGCAVARWEGVILLALGVTLLIGVFLLLRRRARAEGGAPLLLFNGAEGSGEVREWTPPPPEPGSPAWMKPERRDPEIEPAREPKPLPGPQPAPEPQNVPEPQPSSEPDPARQQVMTTVPSPADRKSGGASTSAPPPDGTLELLPGSLEVQNGPGPGQEFRFARVPGEEPVITFGRSSGPRYRHVQLGSATVSRLHARLTLREGGWVLQNESKTNPTSVNGRPLQGNSEGTPLRDGDRIEMGEVVLLFHHPEASDRLPLRSSWYTDRGRRSTNQDAVAVRTLPGGKELAVVCDGMGSHAFGGVASHIALEALVGALAEGADLAQGVREANRAIHRSVEKESEREGMGTTLVALVREGDRYLVANVGDSRAYRVDRTGIHRITQDHSFVAEAMGRGDMSLEEASRSPWRNALTRHLGTDLDLEVDLFGPFDATDPHVVILSTDGVHGVLSDEEMERLARDTTTIQDLAKTLAEAALTEGGEDNVAVAALGFFGEPREDEA